MRAFSFSRLSATAVRLALVAVSALCCTSAALGQGQSNAADLRGFVRDQQGSVVQGATVTARQQATNTERTTTSNDEGFYQITNLPPGPYEVTVEAANFKRAVNPSVTLTVGQQADLDFALEIGAVTESITVTSAPEVIETSRTAVANTIDQTRIDNLPINERNYINFSLTTSTVTRDNGRPIGPAPTSGLNFGGQRGRSNLVQVDGADNTDNSVNAARSTVSQEAVQEFQVVTNSYAPEFGRTSGGVVNVVTKSGTNDWRGNVFGFIRHKSIQARNPFAPIIDGDPNQKPPFTRAQYGVTLGGPLDRDRTFFFGAFEQRRRQESGFFTSDVDAGLSSSVTIGAPFLPFTQIFNGLTSPQAAYTQGLLAQAAAAIGAGQVATGQALAGAAIQYATIASSGSNTALTGTNPLRSPGGAIPAGQIIGPRFFLSGAPVPVSNIAFRPLNSLQTVFPISDETTFSSVRVDHKIADPHQLSMRVGFNPSDITGIQVESQNQSLGQNDFSRTGLQTLRDVSFVTTLTSTLSNSVVNEARFSFSSRRATFRSQNGDAVAFNITGTAFIGRELFSPVIRTETRYQYTDNINWVTGNHTFKFGGDANFISIPKATFELNFAGLFNFGGLSANTLAAFPGNAPAFTPVQQYGLGFPGSYIQGFGNPISELGNKPLAAFAQDSWKVWPNFTLNYGVRYDIELTDQIPTTPFTDPLSGIVLSADDILRAQDVLNVRQGFPRDKNNFAPRAGFAWDLNNNGNTVLRGAFGIFYDHPLLAAAFNSDIADAAQQQQATLLQGSPASTALLNAVQVFQGTVCVPGAALTPVCAAQGGPVTLGVAPSAEYQFGRQRFNDQTFPGFGNILPFTLPVDKDFEYAYANQGNLTIERKLSEEMSISASYLFVGAHHLPLPRDVNEVRQDLFVANFQRYAGNRSPISFADAALATPGLFGGATTPPGTAFANPLGTAAGGPANIAVIVPGIIVAPCTTRVGNACAVIDNANRIINPFAANFFRPSGPNYFLVRALTGLSPAVFNSLLGGTLARGTSVISPFGDANAQSSIGNSVYHAGTFDVRRRFANNFQFLASYTWSHAIDDSSDLQTLLKPQNNRNVAGDRADSLFDQRHRFVFSGVLTSPADWRSGSGWQKVLSNFVIAPIFEASSGRPFNILSGTDTNFDLQGTNERPSVTADGTLCVPGPTSDVPECRTGLPVNGTLGRNRGITHGYMSLDMRVTRVIPFSENVRLEVIAEGFNLFNRFNEGSASPFIDDVRAFNQRDASGRYYSRPTAAFDPRQFQFGLRLSF